MSSHPVINESLKKFDDLLLSNKQYTKTVNAFIKTIKYLFHINEAPDFCRSCFFIRYGSNRERTVVSEEADFDLIMVLPYPFTMDVLYATTFAEGAFMLNLRREAIIDPCYNYLFTSDGKQRRLRSLNLRTEIFNWIAYCLESLKNIWDGWTIIYHRSLTNFKINFDNHIGKSLTIDIIPQIGARLDHGHIPGCITVSSLHPCSQSYIEDHNFSTFFVLGFPTQYSKSREKHLLLQINFGLLELSSIACSENVRNTVRMCKGISITTRMKDLGLASYHIKRTALLHLDQIIDSDPYNGIEIVFRHMQSTLKKGYLQDYFLQKQNLYTRDSEKAKELAGKIERALESIFTFRERRFLQY